MDVNYIVLLAVTIVMGLAYGFIGFFATAVKTGESFDIKKLIATIIYSIIVGVIAVQTGAISLETLANWQAIFSPIWEMYFGIYLGLMYIFSKVVVPVVSTLTKKMQFYSVVGIDPLHKMDEATRHWLVSDQSPALQVNILAAVDDAQAKSTYRYAIEAGAWIYIVEFGVVTGARHALFKWWFGTSIVEWKPITVECLENCRKTGRIPDYNDLY